MTWPFENDTSAIVKKLSKRNVSSNRIFCFFNVLTIALAISLIVGISLFQQGSKISEQKILNLALLIVPPVALVLVFRQWLARHIRWTVALTALCDVLLFWDELFYYESFGLFAVLILVQLAATGAAAFRIYNKQKKD